MPNMSYCRCWLHAALLERQGRHVLLLPQGKVTP